MINRGHVSLLPGYVNAKLRPHHAARPAIAGRVEKLRVIVHRESLPGGSSCVGDDPIPYAASRLSKSPSALKRASNTC
jgi:hypothetical protein